MNNNLIVMVLAVVVVTNFILILVLNKTSKGTPKLVKRDNDISGAHEYEDDDKTRFVGNNSNFASVPNLENKGLKDVIEETIFESNIDATEFLSQTNFKNYGVLNYVDNDKECNVDINKDELILGRDPSQCDVVLIGDKFMGRKHARIFVEDKKLFIEDYNSKNGTYVDNKRIEGISEITKGEFKLSNTVFNIRS